MASAYLGFGVGPAALIASVAFAVWCLAWAALYDRSNRPSVSVKGQEAGDAE